MSTYKLTQAAWLAYETQRARGVLLVHLERDQEYTPQELLTILADYGVTYSNPEYIPIGQQLIADGLIEQVGAPQVVEEEPPPVVIQEVIEANLAISDEVVGQLLDIVDEAICRAERKQQERWEKSLPGLVRKWVSAIGMALRGKRSKRRA